MAEAQDPFTRAVRKFFASKLDVGNPALFSLNFDPLPTSAPLSAFKGTGGTFSAAKAREFVSRQVADRAAYLENGSRFSSIESLSDTVKFNVLLKAKYFKRFDLSEDHAKSDQESFESFLEEAKKRIDNTLVSLGPIPGTYVASTAVPESWLDPEATDTWSTFKQVLTDVDNVDEGGAGDSDLRLRWRLLDPDKLLKLKQGWEPGQTWPPPGLEIPELPEILNRPPWADPTPSLMRTLDMSTVGGGFDGLSALSKSVNSSLPMSFVANVSSTPDGTTHEIASHNFSSAEGFTSLGGFDLSPLFKRAIIPQAEKAEMTDTKDEVTISFKYQVVAIDRHWLFPPFLSSANWYIPDARKGSLTGESDKPGPLHMMAQKFVAIKEVTIMAKFSDADRDAVSSAFALGPFSLDASTDLQGGVLTIPGVQIVAYLDQLLPPLPPRSAPSIAV